MGIVPLVVLLAVAGSGSVSLNWEEGTDCGAADDIDPVGIQGSVVG